MHTLEHLSALRLTELEVVLPFLCGRRKILEIGAGTGEQSRELSRNGFDVEAIEYAHSGFAMLAENRVWPVKQYDGHRIPFSAEHFDCVFTSNVLEHIPHVTEFQSEIQRVLSPGGIAVHLIPSASWRFWTALTHPMFVLPKQLGRARYSAARQDNPSSEVHSGLSNEGEPNSGSGVPKRTVLQKVWWNLVPERHGEFGNTITEHYYFSKRRWNALFKKSGWDIVTSQSVGLF